MGEGRTMIHDYRFPLIVYWTLKIQLWRFITVIYLLPCQAKNPYTHPNVIQWSNHQSYRKRLGLPPKTNSSPLKIDPWKFGDSYGKPPFLGAFAVVSGRVFIAELWWLLNQKALQVTPKNGTLPETNSKSHHKRIKGWKMKLHFLICFFLIFKGNLAI